MTHINERLRQLQEQLIRQKRLKTAEQELTQTQTALDEMVLQAE